MRIQVKTTNFDLTEAIAQNIEEKLRVIENRLRSVEDQDEILARVEVGRISNHHNKGDVYKASVHLEIPGERNLHAEAVEADLATAIDQVKAELEREIRRSHEKNRDAERRGGREAKEIMHEPPVFSDEE